MMHNFAKFFLWKKEKTQGTHVQGLTGKRPFAEKLLSDRGIHQVHSIQLDLEVSDRDEQVQKSKEETLHMIQRID